MAKAHLGLALAYEGRLSKAETVLQEALGDDPRQVDACCELAGHLNFEKDRPEEALAWLERSLAACPTLANDRLRLVGALLPVLAALEQYPRLEQAADEFLELLPRANPTLQGSVMEYLQIDLKAFEPDVCPGQAAFVKRFLARIFEQVGRVPPIDRGDPVLEEERERMLGDQELPDWIYDLAFDLHRYLELAHLPRPEDDPCPQLAAHLSALLRVDRARTEAEWAAFALGYPRLAASLQELWDRFRSGSGLGHHPDAGYQAVPDATGPL